MKVTFILAEHTHPPLSLSLSLSPTALSGEAAIFRSLAEKSLTLGSSGDQSIHTHTHTHTHNVHELGNHKYIHTHTHTHTQTEGCEISASNWKRQGLSHRAFLPPPHEHTHMHKHGCTHTHTHTHTHRGKIFEICKGRLGEISTGVSATPSLWQENPFVYALHWQPLSTLCVCVCVCVSWIGVTDRCPTLPLCVCVCVCVCVREIEAFEQINIFPTPSSLPSSTLPLSPPLPLCLSPHPLCGIQTLKGGGVWMRLSRQSFFCGFIANPRDLPRAPHSFFLHNSSSLTVHRGD